MPTPSEFNTHGHSTRIATLMKRIPDPASVEQQRRPPKEIVVIGKDAHRRVLDVLAKAFPQKSKETPMMTPLAQQADALEKEIEALEKQLSDDGLDGFDRIEETVAALEKASKKGSVAHLGNPVKGPPPPPDPFDDLARENDGDGADDNTDTEAGGRHRFEAMVDFVRYRDGGTKAAAMATARKKYPDLYNSFQSSGLAKSYVALVEDEIRKGCSPEVAAQRVGYAHATLAREAIAKSESSAVAFLDCVTEIRKRDGCGHVEAMRKARAEHPAEFSRYQNV